MSALSQKCGSHGNIAVTIAIQLMQHIAKFYFEILKLCFCLTMLFLLFVKDFVEFAFT